MKQQYIYSLNILVLIVGFYLFVIFYILKVTINII